MFAASASPAQSEESLIAPDAACHGCCHGFQHERDSWAAPRLVASCTSTARPGYDSMSASEYIDTPEVLHAKVLALARLVKSSRKCVIYSGAGLSTGAGIGDYASQSPDSISGVAPPSRSILCAAIQDANGNVPNPSTAPISPLCAQPTLAHRVLVSLYKAGHVYRWINQNHDGLPQKAGLPQEGINEIHGAWHAPDNPVVPMSGSLRDDLFADLLACEKLTDLVIAVGTSLCGMNADRVVTAAAERAARRSELCLGSVVIGLQRTVHDEDATLRIFSRCDDVFALLAAEMEIEAMPAPQPGEYFTPALLVGREESDYLFKGLPYNAAGELSPSEGTLTLDLREDAELVIPRGMHAGAIGVVDGFDREGNVRCRFKLKPKVGKLRAQVPMLLGRWWLQAAADGAVPTLPVVNLPAGDDLGGAARTICELVQAYAGP